MTSADLSSNNQDCRGLIFPGVFSSYDMAYKQYSVAFYSSTHWVNTKVAHVVYLIKACIVVLLLSVQM